MKTPEMLPVRVLTLNKDGHVHTPGTVVRADETHAYLVEASGAFRRVQVVEEAAAGVRYRMIKAATKPEKKAQKRERAKARSAIIDAALRVARQHPVHVVEATAHA